LNQELNNEASTENDKASLSKILDIELKTTNINVEQSVIEKSNCSLPKSKLRSSNANEYNPFIFHFHNNGRHYIRYTACFEEPSVIRRFSNKSKLPVIAQESGTIYREKILNEHLSNSSHIEALKAYKLKILMLQK